MNAPSGESPRVPRAPLVAIASVIVHFVAGGIETLILEPAADDRTVVALVVED
jgi:hypothetical protein